MDNYGAQIFEPDYGANGLKVKRRNPNEHSMYIRFLCTVASGLNTEISMVYKRKDPGDIY